ncbi:MAG: VWA domain-containing protein [Fibrobacteria bacterium]|nr:VWA domain-containing protein [Fibrobacteria bacterium]
MKNTSVLSGLALAIITVLFFSGQVAFGFGKNQVRLEVLPSHPVLMSDKKQKTTIKVGLTGFEIEQIQRSKVNVSLVVDKSGSMHGDKIKRAKEAAEMMVELLGKDDVFSLVAYSSTVETLVPSTKLSDKQDVIKQIRKIRADGSTALFGGVSKGLAEVRKFLSPHIANRVILISDGLANIGPSSPQALGKLGASAAREGIAITTIGLGLGYNEDLMVQLAQNSDGNHAFVENSNDLARIFREELGDVLSVVAQEVEITIECPPGVRPLRVIDRNAEIRGQKILLSLNQLYSNQEKYLLLEVEIPEEQTGIKRDIAKVNVVYSNIITQKKETITQTAMVSFDKSEATVKRKINKKVVVQKTKAIANERSKKAVQLRDKGDVQGASSLMMQNVELFKSQADVLEEPELLEESEKELKDAEEVRKRGSSWGKARKALKKKQYKKENQTKY